MQPVKITRENVLQQGSNGITQSVKITRENATTDSVALD
uniref:Uncharacterized protein n=1 Tax=Arundo donax TaxID=35708 RepID=A0A0A8YTU2_ARUDO